MSKCGVFSGTYFPAFGLNTEKYGLSLRFHSEYGKVGSRKKCVLGHFSCSVDLLDKRVMVKMILKAACLKRRLSIKSSI